jgi:GDP-L-fucose synthase
MTASDHMQRVDVLGVQVYATTMTGALDLASEWITNREPAYAIFRDVHGVMQSQGRSDLLEAHARAGLVTCDGMPLVWATRVAGAANTERVCGHDFVRAFCRRAEIQGWKSFLYGGKEGVANRAAESLRRTFPDLQVVGTYSPPFRALTPDEDERVIDMINRSDADAVWIGLSTPKQELWMREHVGRLEAPALFGIGAAFDFLAGDVRRAPRWLQHTGFEWVHRLVSEPRRLGPRYLRSNPAFARAIVFNRPRLVAGAVARRGARRRKEVVAMVSTQTVPTDARIFVAGHRGLVGSAVVRKLRALGYQNVLTASRDQLDLRDQAAVNYWFRANRPEFVYLVAGTVGGILANSTRPAEFIYDNLMIHGTVVHASHLYRVEKLLYLGSSCIYPRLAEQPISETALLTGPLEPTNEAYAIAKIAGIKLCQAYRRQYGAHFISAMPTNLYGPNDNFDLISSHVLPALIRKFHEAKVAGTRQVEVWGTGEPRREFLHVDDLASACVFLMDQYDEEEHINVGTGVDLSIRELAEIVRDVVYPDAEVSFDTSKPDGMPRKVLDVARILELGWSPIVDLRSGLQSTYEWFLSQEPVGLRGVPVSASVR